jgi:predicted nucleic acid-binding protein
VSAATSRRFRIWYALVIAVVLVAVALLDRALDAQSRWIVAALVFSGLVYVVAAGIVAIVRILRSR